MANNVQVTQGDGTTFKTTETEGVHVGHVHVDTVPLPTGAATEATLGDLKTAAQALAALIDDAALEVKDGAVAALLTAISGYLAGTLTVSGTVTANTGLSQPLTDTQLRATAVPVSGPLTDAQLRDSPVAVSGPLTDAQLRNSAVPVSVSGAATEAKQDSIVEALGGTLLAQLKTPGGADISAGDVSADGLSTGTVGLTTRSVLYGYNGTSIDRIELENDGSIPVTVKSEIQVEAEIATETLPVASIAEAIAVAIVDGDGNQITSFGAGGDGDVNLDEIGGTAIAVGAGTVGNGVQRVTLASDDPAVVDLAAIEVLLTAMDADTSALAGAIGATALDLGVGTGGSRTLRMAIDSSQVQATVAHDAADSGDPLKIGARAIAALSAATPVASGDRSDAAADLDGALITRNGCALGDVVSGTASNTDGSSTPCIAAAGSGIKTYLTDITLLNTSESDIYVELKDGTSVKWVCPVPAKSGMTHAFKTPLAGTANTAWNFDASAATTTVYCSMSGFRSKV